MDFVGNFEQPNENSKTALNTSTVYHSMIAVGMIGVR
jgi:hypothetical protein